MTWHFAELLGRAPSQLPRVAELMSESTSVKIEHGTQSHPMLRMIFALTDMESSCPFEMQIGILVALVEFDLGFELSPTSTSAGE